jgi:hypothetical protein
MCPEPSPAERPTAKTSGSYSKKSAELLIVPCQCLDLTPGNGNLLGESYWELNSAWLGEFLTLNTGPAPPNGAAGSTLSLILEAEPHRKYYLSSTACLGILRRARERGKILPPILEMALIYQAGLLPSQPTSVTNFGIYTTYPARSKPNRE